jgi:hypothetical protein
VIPEGLSCNTRREKISRQRHKAESARTYEESGRNEKMTTLEGLDCGQERKRTLGRHETLMAVSLFSR